MTKHLARLAGFSLGYLLLTFLERIVDRLEAPGPVLERAAAAELHRPLDAPGPDDEPWHCQECGGPCRRGPSASSRLWSEATA